MDAKNLIQDSIKILKGDLKASKYFEANIQWLEQQLEYQQKNIIRIGLIGVTSSGKSTILNALLGEKLLPAAVRPSSGILITCSKSKVKEATVFFEDRKPLILRNEQIKQEINRFGDEKNNPGNQYKVKHIDIKSPHFLLDENVQIVDSPGLEAYGLEYHETLTMETLLPSVDLCIYALTMKANADESTFRALQTIQKHRKPIVIIQNMLDSVEPKKGKDGEIIKTKEQVAFEHKARIERIVEKVQTTSDTGVDMKTLVDIIQLSAKEALIARIQKDNNLFKESKMNDLIHCLRSSLKRLQFFLNKQRKQQVIRHLTELCEEEKANVLEIKEENDSIKRHKSQLQNYQSQKVKIDREYKSTSGKIDSKLQNIQKDVEKALVEIDRLGEDDLMRAEEVNASLRKKVSDLEKNIIDLTKGMDDRVSDTLKTLNINQKDLQNSLFPKNVVSNNQFKVKSKIVQRKKLKEKSGGFSKVSRFFGDIFNKNWGYEETYYDVTVLDTVAMKKQIQKEFADILKQLSHFIKHWEKRVTLAGAKLDEEIKRKDREVQQKSELLLDDKTIFEMIYKIETILKPFREEKNEKDKNYRVVHSSNPNEVEHTGTKKKIHIDESMFAIYQLTNHFIYSHFQQVWQYCQRSNFNLSPFQQTVIWGWDEFSLAQFITRFLNYSLIEKEQQQLKKKGYVLIEVENQRIVIVRESKELMNHIKGLEIVLEKQNYNAYVLVNGMQMGAAIKQLKNSQLSKLHQTKKEVINFVNQSVVEFKGQNMDEGLECLFNIIKEFRPLSQGFTLFNDENPLYSILLLELSRYKQVTLADEQRLIKQITSKYPYFLRNGELNDFVQIMRSYTSSKGAEVV